MKSRLEKAVAWLAWHAPKAVAYQCAIRVMVHATQGPWSSTIVPELTAMDALRRWGAAK